MKRTLFLSLTVISFFSCSTSNQKQSNSTEIINISENPVITHIYTADPSARVFNDTLYIYPSHDTDDATWFDMLDYHVFSTTDLVNYTDHGVAFSPVKETVWAKKYVWAPDCIERNGKYYLYFPTDQEHIGVAVSDSPKGPFKDALGKPLISINSPGVVCERDFIDPCVFIDDDGQAYLFAGQNTLSCVKLNEDMISYNEPVYIIEGVDEFFEAIWMHKYNGKYYLSYSNGHKNGKEPEIAYAISDNVLGPYEHKGVILDPVSSGTNHHSILQYKNNWYIFYHTADLSRERHSGPTRDYRYKRSVCVDKLFYNADGTIQPVVMTKSRKYTPPKEEIEWATQFAAISGQGQSVVGDGRGGWRSGADGVRYKGNNPKPEYDLNFDGMATGTAVENGFVPPIKPAIELHLRDGVVTLGGDGNYYLTGSSGDNIWAFTKGVELWKSPDLKSWEYVGLVWDIDRDADEWVKEWRKHPRRAVRAVWAPEIHYIKGNYFICFSMCPHGIGLLKSSTGKPEGPYVNAFQTDRPIASGIDATLFEDEDGKVYFTYGNATRIALLNDDLSGFAEPFRQIIFDEPDHEPTHHAEKCFKRGMNDLGHEGAVLFRKNGKYYLGAADDYEGRYSTCLAISDSIYGPYKKRHESVPCGGGTGFFKDKEGNWWSSYFGNDSQSHFREKIGFVKVDFAVDGRVFPSKDQPFVSENDKLLWEEKWEKIWKEKY